jgi:UDPglucose 6-dehydrogenase
MVIAIYGAGYVGLVSAVCFAKLGHRVICADINSERIKALNNGECPIYEAELPQLLTEQLSTGRLTFTSDLSSTIEKATIHIIATGTPSLADGSADLSQVYAVATQIAQQIHASGLLIIKSTVPVGTGDALQAYVQNILAQHNKFYQLNVASNPEFLREGTAVYDFLNADRIILGGNEAAITILEAIYQPLAEHNIPLIRMSRLSAELTKYAANTMLACRISFINQISQLAEKVGANIDEIRQGIGSDHRIGPHFLQPGIGYGGSCFPKDNRALIQTAQTIGIEVPLLKAIETINHIQKQWAIETLKQHFKDELQNKTIGIWGLAFKPGTDDMREASSLVIINALLQLGTQLRLYDPVAMIAAKAHLPSSDAIIWCNSADEVLNNVDALVIATEWPVFKEYPLTSLQQMLGDSPIIDGRNCYDLLNVERANIAYYYSVGRPVIHRD